jgi:TM2 domain-containing membrane protein YozV
MNVSKLIRYEANKRSAAIAVVFCIFWGFLGLHRFYVGKKKSGTIMLILSLTVIGLPAAIIWSMVDLFQVCDMVCTCNNDLADKIEQHYYQPSGKSA